MQDNDPTINHIRSLTHYELIEAMIERAIENGKDVGSGKKMSAQGKYELRVLKQELLNRLNSK